MPTILKVTYPTAQKEHICDFCGCKIQPGQKYVRQTNVYDRIVYPIMPKESGFFNKMFVKADLMPHHIEITDIKVERLQDISDEDCMKEGIYRLDSANGNGGIAYSFVGASDKKHIGLYNTPRDAFSALIDKVSGKGTWESNPYVWVYEFKLFD